ncbi:MAG: hypothetical protein PHV21_00020 [Synergistaceae bacterium]|nr:hypothetical protein [Synergistaceae bacterium]
MSNDTKAGTTSKPTPREEAFAKATEAIQTLATGAAALFSAIYNLIEEAGISTDVKAPNPAADQGDHSVAESATATTAPKADPTPETSITPDDIIKACVAVIKRNRENSGRIQALLQTYGVSRMSALDPSSYEAFMADVNALGA